jgi:twitching motility protein PilT
VNSLKILVADDDALIRKMLQLMLIKHGHEVVEAIDGTEALAKLEDSRHHIDIAIIDWGMPGLEGIEVCRRLQAAECSAYLILVTGKGSDQDVIEALEAGANDYLTKPFTEDNLRIRLLVGAKYLRMQKNLTTRVAELEGGLIQREEFDSLLSAMIKSESGVSDLLFVSRKPPQVEAFGKLKPVQFGAWSEPLCPADIERLANFLIGHNERLRADFDATGSCDLSYVIEGCARMRVNVYKQNGAPAIVMRKLESKVPNLEMLGTPPVFQEFIREKNGIILVTGSTGSGKTTTLAAMLNELNETQAIHMVTLEDPIEFLHDQKRATFSQRQLGHDFNDFATGLRAALRQAPKVIFVGEIRDRETIEIAMSAAETGHLVFSTAHTVNAGQTISRILGMFGKDDESQVRQRIAETLRAVISQRLVAKIGGGRQLVTEIMGSSLRTREAISYGESEGRNFNEIIEASTTKGWQSFDQSLLKAYEADLITEDTAMLYCSVKSSMKHKLDRVKQIRGIMPDLDVGLRLAPDSH